MANEWSCGTRTVEELRDRNGAGIAVGDPIVHLKMRSGRECRRLGVVRRILKNERSGYYVEYTDRKGGTAGAADLDCIEYDWSATTSR